MHCECNNVTSTRNNLSWKLSKLKRSRPCDNILRFSRFYAILETFKKSKTNRCNTDMCSFVLCTTVIRVTFCPSMCWILLELHMITTKHAITDTIAKIERVGIFFPILHKFSIRSFTVLMKPSNLIYGV